MTDARKDYALKGLNVIACMFVSSYYDTLKQYGSYDIQKHNQLFLNKFKDFGYAGSRMDDFLPFYEMYSNTIEVGVPMRKLLTKKSEHVANSQKGFADFVDDNIMQMVPVVKLDEYISLNCNSNYLDIVMTPDSKLTFQNESVTIDIQLPVEDKKKPWYTNPYLWIGVSTFVVVVLCLLLFMVFKNQNTLSNTVVARNTGYKNVVRSNA